MIEKKIADVVTGSPVIVIKRTPKTKTERFLVNHPVLARIYILFGGQPFQKEIKFAALSLGTLYRISGLIAQMNVPKPDGNLQDWIWGLITDNTDSVVRAIASAIHNRKSEVPESLIDFVKESMSPQEVQEAMQAISDNIDVQSFISTISSIRSLDLLSQALSPPSTGETIAPGVQ